MSVIFIKNQKYKPPLPKGRGTKLCLVEGYKNFEFKISNFEFSKPLAAEGYKYTYNQSFSACGKLP